MNTQEKHYFEENEQKCWEKEECIHLDGGGEGENDHTQEPLLVGEEKTGVEKRIESYIAR